ncbi:unnamed protein product [Pleuronectes platessa]|uniref:Uncharacterized protein n=1 Tax=Pleuronectes platessa TaxID=8262 RepID=A0A9N7UQB6_PLEPL|nr:unnamed protein product [Pleuronectes platessa]
MTAVGLKSAGFCAVPTAVSMVAIPVIKFIRKQLSHPIEEDREGHLLCATRPLWEDASEKKLQQVPGPGPTIAGTKGGRSRGGSCEKIGGDCRSLLIHQLDDDVDDAVIQFCSIAVVEPGNALLLHYHSNTGCNSTSIALICALLVFPGTGKPVG